RCVTRIAGHFGERKLIPVRAVRLTVHRLATRQSHGDDSGATGRARARALLLKCDAGCGNGSYFVAHWCAPPESDPARCASFSNAVAIRSSWAIAAPMWSE